MVFTFWHAMRTNSSSLCAVKKLGMIPPRVLIAFVPAEDVVLLGGSVEVME